MKYGMKLEIFIFFLYAIKDEPEARPKTTLFAGGEGMHKSTLKFNAFDVLVISNDFLRGNDVITVSRINWLLLTRNGFISVFDFFFQFFMQRRECWTKYNSIWTGRRRYVIYRNSR